MRPTEPLLLASCDEIRLGDQPDAGLRNGFRDLAAHTDVHPVGDPQRLIMATIIETGPHADENLFPQFDVPGQADLWAHVGEVPDPGIVTDDAMGIDDTGLANYGIRPDVSKCPDKGAGPNLCGSCDGGHGGENTDKVHDRRILPEEAQPMVIAADGCDAIPVGEKTRIKVGLFNRLQPADLRAAIGGDQLETLITHQLRRGDNVFCVAGGSEDN